MAKIKSEDLRLNIIINGEEKFGKLRNATKLTSMTMGELTKHANLTRIALNKAVPGTAQWKALNKELRDTKARLSELKSGGNGVASTLKNMKGSVLAVVASIAVVARTIKSFVSTIADFEQANANLSTVLGTSTLGIQRLTNDALKLGRTTQYTASQVSGLQMELAKLGFTQEQIHQMTAPTLNFATAVGTDLSSASKLAGAALRIFGLDAAKTEDSLSVLAVATNKSALDFSYLENAMSTVGPVAKAFGFSLRDTTALLGTLANAGFDASSAATATRNILLNLANSSGKLATALGGPVKTFPEMMEGLKQLRSMGVDLNTTLELTDKRSVAAFNSFLDGADSAIELRESLQDVNGELDRIANERMNTVQGSVKALQSAWEGFVLAFSNSKGPIKDILDWLAGAINKVTDDIKGPEQDSSKNGQKYFQSILRVYSDDMEKTRQALNEDLAKAESDLTTLQKRLANASGLINKRRIKAEIQEKQGLVQTIKDAQTAYSAYIKWQNSLGQDGDSGNQQTTEETTPTTTEIPSGKPDKKNVKSWSLDSDEAYLKAKAALIDKYNQGEIKTQEELDKQLGDLEIASLTARLATNKEAGADREKLNLELQQKIKAQHDAEMKIKKEAKEFEAAVEDEKTKTAIAAEEKRYDEELKNFEKLKDHLENASSVKETIGRKHQNNLNKINLEAFDRGQELLKKQHENEIKAIENKYKAGISSIKNGSAEEIALTLEMTTKVAEQNRDFLTKEINALETLLDNTSGLTEEQIANLQAKLASLNAELNSVNDTLNGRGVNFGTGEGELFGVSEKSWVTMIEHLKEGKASAADMASIIAGIGGVADEAFKLTSQAISMTNAREKEAFKEYEKDNEKKKKDLKNRLDAGIIDQKTYDTEVAALEEEAQAKKEAMELEQAERQKKMSLAQAIIQTTLSVAKTFAQWGYPWGLIPAGIMAAIGAAQVAMIAATPAGYAEGGLVQRQQDGKPFNARLDPTRRGYVSSPTILVGEEGGEYVVPADGLNNPTLAPLLATIETARRNGTLRGLNFGAVYSPAASVAYASGGYTAGAILSSVQKQDAASSAALADKLDRILAKMDEPTPAVVSFLGKNGIKEAQDTYDRYQRRGAL